MEERGGAGQGQGQDEEAVRARLRSVLHNKDRAKLRVLLKSLQAFKQLYSVTSGELV